MPHSVHADLIELRADPVTREYIDVNDGIERVMGRRDLYARMLLRFRDDYPHGIVPIAAALSAGDKLLAQRLTITLKGRTGMIGAHRLHACACTLDQALLLDQETSPAVLELAQEFEKVLDVLHILLEGSPPEGQLLPVAVRPLVGDEALLTQLEVFLKRGDGAAIDMIDEAAASLKIILGDERLLRVSQAARRFEFGEALRALEDRTMN